MDHRIPAQRRRWPRRPTLPALMTAAALAAFTLLSGCFDKNYAGAVSDYPNCVNDANISPYKVEYCEQSSSGDFQNFNGCLASEGVPPVRIERLHQCVHALRNDYDSNPGY